MSFYFAHVSPSLPSSASSPPLPSSLLPSVRQSFLLLCVSVLPPTSYMYIHTYQTNALYFLLCIVYYIITCSLCLVFYAVLNQIQFIHCLGWHPGLLFLLGNHSTDWAHFVAHDGTHSTAWPWTNRTPSSPSPVGTFEVKLNVFCILLWLGMASIDWCVWTSLWGPGSGMWWFKYAWPMGGGMGGVALLEEV